MPIQFDLLKSLGLASPTIKYQGQDREIIRSGSLIIHNSPWGAIASLELNNSVASDKNWELYAQFIFKMFQQNIVFLALQNVPSPNTSAFRLLFNELTKLNGASNLINLKMLEEHYAPIGKILGGIAVVCNPRFFEILDSSSCIQAHDINGVALDGRFLGRQYRVKACSGDTFYIANIYSDRTKQNQIETIVFESQFTGISTGALFVLGQFEDLSRPGSIQYSTWYRNRAGEEYQINFVNDTVSKIKNERFQSSSTAIIPAGEELSPSPRVFAKDPLSFIPSSYPLRGETLNLFKKYLTDKRSPLIQDGQLHPETIITVTKNTFSCNTPEILREFITFSIPIFIEQNQKMAKERTEKLMQEAAMKKKAEEIAKEEADAKKKAQEEQFEKRQQALFDSIRQSIKDEVRVKAQQEQQSFEESLLPLKHQAMMRQSEKAIEAIENEIREAAAKKGIQLTPEQVQEAVFEVIDKKFTASNDIELTAKKAKEEADRLAAEQAKKAKDEADRLAAEQAKKAKDEADRLAAEQAKRAKEEADRLAAEQAKRAKEEADRLAAEQAKRAKEEADRLAAEQVEKEKDEIRRIEREELAEIHRLAKQLDEEERLRAEQAKQEAEKTKKEADQLAVEGNNTQEKTQTRAPTNPVIPPPLFNPFAPMPLRRQANQELIDVIDIVINNIQGVNPSTRTSWYGIGKSEKIELLELVKEHLKHSRPLRAENLIKTLAFIRDICGIKRNFFSPLFKTAVPHSVKEFDTLIKDDKKGPAILEADKYKEYENYSFEEKTIKSIKSHDELKDLIAKGKPPTLHNNM